MYISYVYIDVQRDTPVRYFFGKYSSFPRPLPSVFILGYIFFLPPPTHPPHPFQSRAPAFLECAGKERGGPFRRRPPCVTAARLLKAPSPPPPPGRTMYTQKCIIIIDGEMTTVIETSKNVTRRVIDSAIIRACVDCFVRSTDGYTVQQHLPAPTVRDPKNPYAHNYIYYKRRRFYIYIYRFLHRENIPYIKYCTVFGDNNANVCTGQRRSQQCPADAPGRVCFSHRFTGRSNCQNTIYILIIISRTKSN